ncbi:AI-2E family transporter [Comamonas sp. GB3 AK4-5]|uniref:AI-2E family transporter n=1 Tax=Comamonas sp. GB3 AK4-5 TaxID=3231487 RepID=UPI00351E2E7F
MRSDQTLKHAFTLLLIAVTCGFLGILWPFAGAIFWAVVLAILFQPLNRRLHARMPRARNTAALLTLLTCLLIVILPLIAVTLSVIQEAVSVYHRLSTGQMDFGTYIQQIKDALPNWALDLLHKLNLSTLTEIQQRLSTLAGEAAKSFATQAVSLGQNTMSFVVSFGIMLYLLFFLLRDGMQLAARVLEAVPLDATHKSQLLSKFTTVIKATVKGNLAVAMAQGALGGLIFWIMGIEAPALWGVLMAFLSLLPAIGASLIWGPVAIYFLAAGNVSQGIILIAYGLLVIGLVDNLLRPLLVGKDTKMPDYVVLISTIGGMSLFGLSGFVIGPAIAALFMATWEIFAPPHSASDTPSS